MDATKSAAIGILSIFALTNTNAQNEEEEFLNAELEEFVIVGHDDVRQMREASMPISVISVKQLEGTSTNINDALA